MTNLPWLIYVAYFFGGAFLANAVPHTVAGVMGRGFQSPFAKPPGQGLSTSLTNVIWGFANLVVAYLLLCKVGAFDIRDITHIGPAALGALVMSLQAASHFGRFNGGDKATPAEK